MGAIAVFNEYKDEIQQLFRSEYRMMILLSLYDGSKSLSELEKTTSIASSSIINNSKLWIDYGFIQKNNSNYMLTATGQIMTSKILSLLKFSYMLKNNEEMPDIGNLIKLYQLNNEFVNEIMRSYIIMMILLHLEESGKTRDELKEITDSTSQVLTPRIRWLIANSLIEEKNQGFNLTLKGNALINEIRDIIFTSATLIKHSNYFRVHLIDELPKFALENIGDLFYTKEVYDTPEKPFKNYENWMKIIDEAGYLHSISNYVTPGVSDIIAKKVMEGVPMDILGSGELAQEIFREPYIKYMKDLGKYPHLNWYVGNFPRVFGITITDKCLTIKFSINNPDTFDTSSGLVSRSDEAREWGEKLFEYYKSSAVPLLSYIEKMKK